MSDLGELLKKAREQRGLSLEEIQEATKIRKRYLEAIESGDYKVLPGTFYVRAFVKTYAEMVGLDADDVLRLYKHEIPAASAETTVEPIVRKPRRSSTASSDRWSKFGFTGIMLSFVIVIAVVVWIYAINKSDGSTAPRVDDETKITDSTDAPDEPKQETGTAGQDNTNTTDTNGTGTGSTVTTPEPPVQETTTVTLASKSGRVDHYDVGPAGSHTMQVTIKGGKNWLEVREGSSKGKKLYFDNATDGTVQSYPLTGSLYVNVGRADLVEISIDGVVVEDGNRPSSKKMQFDPIAAADTGTGSANAGTAGEGTTTNEGEVQNVQ